MPPGKKRRHNFKRLWAGVAIFLILLTLGFFGVATLRSHFAADSGNNTVQENLIDQIEELDEENSRLSASVSSLLNQRESYSLAQNFDAQIIKELEDANKNLKAQAGYTEIISPGLLLELNDNSEAAAIAQETSPEDYDPELYIIHDTTLLFLINDLRPYAQAIAINGQRVLASTAIRCVGTVIMIDQTRLAPPYQIMVAGDKNELMTALKNSSIYSDLLDSQVLFTAIPQEEIIVPAYTGTIPHNHLTAAGQEQESGQEQKGEY